MIFEVDVVTTAVKRVRVNAEDMAHARIAAKELDDSGIFSEIKSKIVGRKYEPHYRCSRCGRLVDLFFGANDDYFCIPCYKELSRGWQRKVG